MATLRGEGGDVLGGSSHGLTAPEDAGAVGALGRAGAGADVRSRKTESFGAEGSSKTGVCGDWSCEAVFTAPAPSHAPPLPPW